MRTKILLTAAAALAAGVVSSSAQVTSANVVGYVNIPATNYVLLNNPVDYITASGTTNNAVTNLIGATLPVNSQILVWTGSGFSANSYLSSKSGNSWQNPGQQLPPGKGFFVFNSGASTVTNTYIGQVEQGNLVNPNIVAAGYSLVGGQYPVVGGVTNTFGYKATVGDQVLAWTGGGYSVNSYLSSKSGNSWSAGAPQLNVGQGVFIFTSNPSPVMSNTFLVP